MPLKDSREDSEPMKVEGVPMSFVELIDMATPTPQDISKALNRFREGAPSRYKELID